MKILKNIILFLITLTVLLCLPPMLGVYSLNKTVMEPYSWNTYMTESGAYESLEPRIKGHLFERDSEAYQANEQLNSEAEQLWFRESAAAAVNEIVTAEWMEGKFDELQTKIWDYILQESDTIDPIRFQQLTESIKRKVIERVDSLEAPEEEKAQIRAELKTKMSEFKAELDIVQVSGISKEDLTKLRDAYVIAGSAFAFFVLLMCALWISGAATAFYPSRVISWTGWTLLFSSLWIGIMWVGAKVVQFGENLIPDGMVPATLKEIGFLVLDQMMLQVSRPMIIAVIIMFVAAIILLPSSYMSILAKWDGKIHDKVKSRPYVRAIRAGVVVLAMAVVLIYGLASGALQIS